jgi:2-C-methyl-D-erythritol 4-phosphate cytidylyltransferase
MKKFAVIVAGGSGSRMASTLPKQFMLLRGKPVLWHTLQAFLQAYPDLQIILVLPEKYITEGKEIAGLTESPDRIQLTPGGETRFHSVRNGLELVEDGSIVFVHDAVRCLVTAKLIQRCYDHAVLHVNAIPAIHSADSIRIDQGNGPVPFDRSKVFAIQTPQTFHSDILKDAYENEYNDTFTDEATVAEAAGVTISLVEGETTNIKITWPVDLLVAEAILASGH